MPATTPILGLPYPVGTDPVSDGDDAIHALASGVESVLTRAWTEPSPLLNGWGNHSSGAYAGYRVIGHRVELKGLIASGTIGSACFQLPAEMRPTKDRYIATASNNAFGLIIVTAAGGVNCAAGSNAWFSLDVSFGLGGT